MHETSRTSPDSTWRTQPDSAYRHGSLRALNADIARLGATTPTSTFVGRDTECRTFLE